MSELKKIKRKGAKKKKSKTDSKRSFRLGLKGKLLLYFLLMAIIPAGALTIFSSTQMMASFTEDRLNQLDAVGANKFSQITSWFGERKGDANFLSQTPALVTYSAVLNNETSSPSEKSEARSEIESSFEEMVYHYGVYEQIMFVTSNGTLMAEARAPGIIDHVIGEDLSDDPIIVASATNAFFQNGSKNVDYAYLSDYAKVGGKIDLMVGSPVWGSDDSLTGFIFIEINEETVMDVMEDVEGLGTSGECYLVNHDLEWMTHSKFEGEDDWYMTGTGAGRGYTDIYDTILDPDAALDTDGIKEALAGKKEVTKSSNLDYRGIPVMGSYHYLEINSEENAPWVLVTEIDVAEALKAPLDLQQISIWIMVAVAGVVAVIAFIIARQIANPVKELSDLSETIAGGNYEVEVDIKAQDEVEDLVANFRVMKENVLNALKYSENLITGLPVSVMAIDNDFNIEKLNPTLESLLGIKATDLIGKKCYDIFRYDICNTENCQVRKAWRLNGITDSEDIKTHNRDGQQEMELRISSSPIRDGDGNTTGGIEVSLDVTLENQMTREVELAAEQISASVEELSSSAEEVSASSENIASTQQQLSKGSAEQVMAITETQRKFGDLSKGIRTIREKVENIGQVADLIKGIASQTNMLALNAAIEAARAGEAGRGFNVVADQVRKLADESRNAVANTEEMLAEIDVISKQQEGGALEILKAIDNIATIAEESSSSTEEAASAAEEQASSMEQITSSAQTLMSIVQKLEALIEASNKSKGGSSERSTGVDSGIKESYSGKNKLEKEIVVDNNENNPDSAF